MDFPAKKYEQEGYDITYETNYYTSYTYKSELRVLGDMALIDILSLDEHRIRLQLIQLNRVNALFRTIWVNYHEHYHEYNESYELSYLFDIRLHSLFIVNNLKSARENFAISPKFVEDLGDSLKLREKALRELIEQVEELLPEYWSDLKQFQMEQEKQSQEQKSQHEKKNNEQNLQVADEKENQKQEQKAEMEPPKVKFIKRSPMFAEGVIAQFYSIFKSYFAEEEHLLLSNLLFKDEVPSQHLIFRGKGNQLADAFLQLFEANMIVGCQKTDLEKWIAPKFLYLSKKGNTSEFTEGYLSGLISTNSKPCKSPILKIEQQGRFFVLLPVPKNKKNK
ncbi:hypothetical protein [uncultured Mucilaginibacter sp.]|uniref:hypothetical protein n=1 Tax=uncultured Mucilaginibacter sp. TaxID=797541 RepID=UPI002613F6E4|nr:hypothetical protein [uncultured Mucilaginibacter sp.]